MSLLSISRFTTIRLTLDISCQLLNNGFIGTIYKGDVMHTEQTPKIRFWTTNYGRRDCLWIRSSKVIVVTGGHSVIGLETIRVLSNAGASIIVGTRDLQKAQGALKIEKRSSGTLGSR